MMNINSLTKSRLKKIKCNKNKKFLNWLSNSMINQLKQTLHSMNKYKKCKKKKELKIKMHSRGVILK